MTTPPKILVACSGRMSVPAMHQLAALGSLAGVVVPDADSNASALLQQVAASLQCPFHSLSRSRMGAQLMDLHAQYRPDAVFVIGFPWRIPEAVLSLPVHGFLNFHGGPLPTLRGPDPLFEAIRQGLPETALTVHRMDAGLDTGPVVYEDRFPLPPDNTHGLLGTQMAFRCAQAILLLLERLQHPLSPQPQATADDRYYPRATASDLYIRWQSQPAASVAALIRACNPVYGGAATTFNGWTFRLTDAAVLSGATHTAPAGTVLETSVERGALIQCLDEAILQVFVIGTDEGYFPAWRLPAFGMTPGIRLESPSPAPHPNSAHTHLPLPA